MLKKLYLYNKNNNNYYSSQKYDNANKIEHPSTSDYNLLFYLLNNEICSVIFYVSGHDCSWNLKLYTNKWEIRDMKKKV